MNKASSAIENSQGQIFLRNATGLTREVSLLDAFIMNTFGMNIAVGAVFLFLQAPAFFPNGNMLVARHQVRSRTPGRERCRPQPPAICFRARGSDARDTSWIGG